MIPLSQKAGQEYSLLYRAGLDEDRIRYYRGENRTLPRRIEIEKMLMPAGTYYLEYEIKDMFMRSIPLDRIELYWDGKEIRYPEGFTWEGKIRLVWTEEK